MKTDRYMCVYVRAGGDSRVLEHIVKVDSKSLKCTMYDAVADWYITHCIVSTLALC